MSAIYRITEINSNNKRVKEINFKIGEEVPLKALKTLASEEALIYEKYTENSVSNVNIKDYYKNLLVRAEAV